MICLHPGAHRPFDKQKQQVVDRLSVLPAKGFFCATRQLHSRGKSRYITVATVKNKEFLDWAMCPASTGNMHA